MSFTVAIDGPAAAGKGTIGRAVAARFGFAHLDTGLLYRAVGRRMLQGVAPIAAAVALTPEDLSTPDELRTAAVADAASKVAVIPEVRAALLDFQRAFARRAGGAVLDGRDIGTVICPEAEVKLFVTASAEVRAERRLKELLAAGFETDLETVLADVRQRDARDAARAASPLKPADDAHVLDTSAMDADAAFERAVAFIEARNAGIEARNEGA
jgi:cytidylate kinase